jgi:hypothetical protein
MVLVNLLKRKIYIFLYVSRINSKIFSVISNLPFMPFNNICLTLKLIKKQAYPYNVEYNPTPS